jgi:hypothetical protein
LRLQYAALRTVQRNAGQRAPQSGGMERPRGADVPLWRVVSGDRRGVRPRLGPAIRPRPLAGRYNASGVGLSKAADVGCVRRSPAGSRGLIQLDRPGGAETGEVIDAGPPLVAHRRHRRVPRHPEVPGRLGDRVLRRAHTASDLGPGSLGEHGPGGDLIAPLGPRARRARRLGAAPQALGPHQHHRPIRQRQITDHHPPPPMADRPHTTERAQARSSVVSTASHHSPRRHLAAGRTPRTRRVRAARRRRYRHVPSGASCRCSRWTAASIARPLTAPRGPSITQRSADTPPRFNAESRQSWSTSPGVCSRDTYVLVGSSNSPKGCARSGGGVSPIGRTAR